MKAVVKTTTCIDCGATVPLYSKRQWRLYCDTCRDERKTKRDKKAKKIYWHKPEVLAWRMARYWASRPPSAHRKYEERKERRRELDKRICPICGENIVGKSKSQLFCSQMCFRRHIQRETHMKYVNIIKNGVKRCSKCGQEKKLLQFCRNHREPLGLAGWCRSCMNRTGADYRKEEKARGRRAETAKGAVYPPNVFTGTVSTCGNGNRVAAPGTMPQWIFDKMVARRPNGTGTGV